MIIKQFDIKNKIDRKIKYYLFHGVNRGLIEETINTIFKKKFSENIINYDESEILNNADNFKESIFNKSLFESTKTVIINRATDKIFLHLKDIIENDPDDIWLIINSSILDKKSKLRNFFEKQSNTIASAFYEDNYQSLINFSQNFLRDKNIKISLEILNLIIERSKGDRINLKNELEKITLFSNNNNPINLNQIKRLTNLAENYDLSELVDNYLAKNEKKTLKILNENNLYDEEIIKIVRLLIQRLKRLNSIKMILKKNNNLDQILASFRPPIFWKDKEIIKHQLKNLTLEKIKFLIVEINHLELNIKKNSFASQQLLNNFILERFRLFSNSI